MTEATTTLTRAALERFTGAVNGSLTRSHDADFRVKGLALNGANIALAYDPDGLLTQAGELQFTRDSGNGLIRGSTLGSVHTTQTYNAFGEPSAFSASHNATALYAYTLAYDVLGRIIGKTETLAGVTTSYQYAYDTAGRLQAVSQDGSVIRSYGYDANGNRSTVNGSPVASYDEQDRLLAYEGKTYGYTARGTLTQKTEGAQSTQYQYDAFGNLATVTLPEGTAIEYLVDGKNRRVGKTVGGILAKGYLYQSQLRVAAELDGGGNLESRYVYGSKVNVPEYMVKTGQTYRLLTDHLG